MTGVTRKFKGRHIIEQNKNVVRAVNALIPIAQELDRKLAAPVAEEQLILLKKTASDWAEFIDPRASYVLTLAEAKGCHAFPTLTTDIVFSNLDQAIRELSHQHSRPAASKVDELLSQLRTNYGKPN